MVGCRFFRRLVFGPGAEPEEEAGPFLLVERKVLGAERRVDDGDVLVAGHAAQRGRHPLSQSGVVVGDRIPGGDCHIRSCTAGSGNVLSGPFDAGVNVVTLLLVDRTNSANHLGHGLCDVMRTAAANNPNWTATTTQQT